MTALIKVLWLVLLLLALLLVNCDLRGVGAAGRARAQCEPPLAWRALTVQACTVDTGTCVWVYGHDRPVTMAGCSVGFIACVPSCETSQ